MESVWKRRFLIVGLVALGVGLGWLYGHGTPDSYLVSTRIDIAKQRPFGITKNGSLGLVSFGEGYAESQVYYPTKYSLLASRNYADKLFRVEPHAAGTEFPMWDWLTWPAYGGSKPEADGEGDFGTRLSGAAEFETIVGMTVLEFRRRFAFRAYGPAAARSPSSAFSDPGDLLGFLLGRLTVKPEKGTTLVEISLEGEAREVLAPLLNLLIEVFAREERTASQRRLDGQRALLRRQHDRIDPTSLVPGVPADGAPAPAKGELEEAREAVEGWTSRHLINADTLELDKKALAVALQEDQKSLREAAQQLAKIQADVDALLPAREGIEDAARRSAATAVAKADPDSAADQRIREELQRIVKDGGGDGDGSFDVKRLLALGFVIADSRVAEASAKVRAADTGTTGQMRLVELRNAAVRDAVVRLVTDATRQLTIRIETRKLEAKHEADRQKRWAEATELSGLQGRLDRAKNDLHRVEDTLAEVENEASLERDLKPLRVIERAGDPWKPFRPNRPLLLAIGGGLALLLGFSLAFLLDWLDDTVGDPRDVERYIGSPVVGTILAMPASDLRGGVSADRVAAEMPRSPVAEAFRAVRTAVEFAPVEGAGGRLLLVTSCSPREGKTTVALNLASVLAQDGKRTLIVDGDLRKPRLHKALGIPGEIGISNVIAGRARLEDVVVPSGQENLWVLPCGAIPPNPAELLGRPAAAALLDRLRVEYDRVVFDTPPLGAVTDAAVLARKVDQVLLVVVAGRTKKRSAEHGAHVLRAVGVEPTGIVMNQVKRGSRWIYGAYYEPGSAGYYGGEG